jgi:nucleoid-associated protein YgaU
MTHRNHWLQIGLLSILLLGLAGCSSSKKSDGDAAALDEATDQMAQTDPAPADGAEAMPPLPAEDQGEQAVAAPVGDMSDLDKLAEAPPASDMPPAMDEEPAAPPAREPGKGSAPAPDLMASAAAPVATTGQFTDYKVQSADTLMKIAFETYGDVYQWKKIWKDNRDRIQDPNSIPVGTVLKLDTPASAVSIARNGDRYEIQPGDTLGKISDNIYGTPKKWRKLWENNKQLIKDPNRIFAGFTLYYQMTPEEKQDAERLKQQIKNPPLAGTAPPAATPPQARAPASAAPGAPVPSGPTATQ